MAPAPLLGAQPRDAADSRGPWRDAQYLDPASAQDTEQRRALNIKVAYALAREAANQQGWSLDRPFIQALHEAIARDIPHERGNTLSRETFTLPISADSEEG